MARISAEFRERGGEVNLPRGSMTNSTRTREAPAGASRVFIYCRSRLTHPDPDQGRRRRSW